MENQNNNSGVNTLLIVIVLVVLVGGLVWFFSNSAPEQTNGLDIDVNLPAGNDEPAAE